ncbi:MAG: hypothetical protein LBF83_04110 [Spirochaetaceae bacterium]|jgi:hypothetical protein|nr:hypothetical protein [Spirochaetaceae bacterium]
MKKENVPGILLFDDARYSQRKAQEQCAALVDILLKNIGGYVEACDKVCSGIKVFLEETLADNVTMNGQDGKSGLNTGSARNTMTSTA